MRDDCHDYVGKVLSQSENVYRRYKVFIANIHIFQGVIAYIVINIANGPTQYRDLLRNMMIIYYQYNSSLHINEISICFM